jgi:hypothetical protein
VRDEDLASQPGGVATRTDEEPDDAAAEHVFSPKDFRLNLGTKLAVAPEPEPLPNLDNPAIRTLTWEHVVPDRPASSPPGVTTTVPLPPPSQVPPPPPVPSSGFQPPAPAPLPQPSLDAVANAIVHADVVEDVEIYEDDEALDEVDVYIEDEFEVDDEVEVALDDEPDADDEPDDELEPAAEVVAARVSAPVAAEVNRLGSVPDLIDEDDSLIELPPITPSGPVVASPQGQYSPVLAETLYIPPPQARATTTVAVMLADEKPHRRKQNFKSPSRKPKRHLFRTFMTLVVLFGLLAGGAFAAKKYLLQEPKWTAELKPLADGVSIARDLDFKLSVEVTELPVADYAHRLATSTIDSPETKAPMWRALGLVNGELDLDLIGRQAVNDLPAFYDPATKTIVVTDDLKSYEHLYRFAIRRALTTALLDQEFDWSTRVATATPAAALAIRATIDGDALAVANALATSDSPDQLAPELFSFVQANATSLAPSQYAAAITGRPGVAMRPTIAAMVDDPIAISALEQAVPSSDGLLDPARSGAIPATLKGTQGMMFWYYVLAGRIDDGQAWAAAINWASDSITTTGTGSAQCVDAKVGAADANGAAVLLATFASWAAVAPLESATTVTPLEGNQVAIHACDPGAAVTATIPVKVPVAFGGAGVERALVQAAISAAGNSKVDATCLVTAARLRAVPLASPADDAPVLAVNWQPAYVTANLDLAAGCVDAPAAVPPPG